MPMPKAVRVPNKTCETCGEAFYAKPGKLGRFCSRSCRAKKTGTPNLLKSHAERPALEERFWNKFIPEPNSGCWLWEGSVTPAGYGRISDGNKTRSATHVSLEIAGRAVPDGLWALHTCDNPYCVNPDHLFHGDAFDNMADCSAKGRNRTSKMVCRKGHPMVRTKFGGRYTLCMTCKLESNKHWKARKRAALRAERATASK